MAGYCEKVGHVCERMSETGCKEKICLELFKRENCTKNNIFKINHNRVNNYRDSHKRCKFCIYLKLRKDYDGAHNTYTWYECTAKEKAIMFPSKFPRRYCSCFNLKDFKYEE